MKAVSLRFPRVALALGALTLLAALAACGSDGGGKPLAVTIETPAAPPTLETGESLDFSATAGGGTPPFEFAWNFDADGEGGGPKGSSEREPADVVFANAGTFTVVVTASDGAGQAATDSLAVTVKGSKALGVTITSPAGDQAIATGESLDFAASATGGETPYSYAWDFDADGTGGGPAVSSAQEPAGVLFATAGTYRAQVTVTDAADARASATVTITVGPAGPAVTITSPAGDQTLFIGGSLDFAATGSGGQAPYSYAWDFDANGAGGGPPPSAVQNPTGVLYTTAGSYRARVTVTDALAATGSASLNVRVSAPGAPVLELEPIKDNSIYGESENSNGAGTSLFAGRTQPGNIRRALLAFDLSTLPAGAVVSSVTLTLTLQQTRDAGARTFTLHRLSENWGEGTSTGTGGGGAGGSPTTGDATWNFAFYNGTDWGVAGGAFEAVVSADWAIGKTTGPVSISTAGLAADVAFWRSNPGLNFGWLLRDGNDDGSSGTPANQTARRFGSRESTSATVRPLLRIEYTLP